MSPRQPASRFVGYLDDDAVRAIEQVEKETRTHQGDRDGDQQREEFLAGFGGFGEEGHVQLQFVSGVSSGPWGKVWQAGFFVPVHGLYVA